MNHRYSVEWTYKGENKIHTTFVECKCKTVKSALDRFKYFYKRIHNYAFDEQPFVVVGCIYLGKVIKKCW